MGPIQLFQNPRDIQTNSGTQFKKFKFTSRKKCSHVVKFGKARGQDNPVDWYLHRSNDISLWQVGFYGQPVFFGAAGVILFKIDA